jgi:hypothetical protein
VSILHPASSTLAVSDPGSTRLVYATIVGLLLIGFALVALGIWLIRQTRVDLPVLAPLERMGDRNWRRQTDPASQRRLLDEVRPDGAEPLRLQASPPAVDADFDVSQRPVASMNDLAPPAAGTRAPTPAGIERPELDDVSADLARDGIETSATEP